MVVVNKTKHQDKDTFISFSSGTLLFGKHKAYRYPEFCFPFLPPPPPPHYFSLAPGSGLNLQVTTLKPLVAKIRSRKIQVLRPNATSNMTKVH